MMTSDHLVAQCNLTLRLLAVSHWRAECFSI